MKKNQEKLKLFGEVFGLSPLPLRLRQAMVAILGEKDVPRSKFGFSSLKQLYPKISPKLWRGKFYLDKTVIISNLFNHTQTPIEKGWSVAKTQTLDFRGRNLTYDSHNGTDFAVPVGTTVCTAAAGEVVSIRSEFNRGGLKIFIDHGSGLMTCYAHLARRLVQKGDVLKRGQPIASSGYSGIDGFITFPFGIPHIHFNVWLNAEPIDPFPYKNQTSLWISGSYPKPAESADSTFQFIPSEYSTSQIENAILACKTKEVQKRLNSIEDLKTKATELIIEMNYYPTRFTEKHSVYSNFFERKPMLDLPFLKEDIENLVFLDDIV